MSSLVNISDSTQTLELDAPQVFAHTIHALPVLVIFPHNQCNCRCVMCDIWRIREAREITPADLEQQLDSFQKLGVKWVVFSGGEPQLNEKWAHLAKIVRSTGSRLTLLTAGLLLKSQAHVVADSVDDVIVSLDGPPELHNTIRRVRGAFEQLAEGVRAVREFRPDMPIRARCTVQQANHCSLRAVIRSAKAIGLTSVSFLAVDVTSTAFNHPDGWRPDRANAVALTPEQVDVLDFEIEQLITEHCTDLDSGYVVETPHKLRRIVQHFRAHAGQAEHVAPHCNAPWVSAVIEASGDVRPCFFHPVLGNIHSQPLPEILNGPQALSFRANLDIASNPTCRKCVCSLHIPRQDDSRT